MEKLAPKLSFDVGTFLESLNTLGTININNLSKSFEMMAYNEKCKCRKVEDNQPTVEVKTM